MPALRDGRLDRSGYTLEFDERFDGAELDRSRWFPWYLPQWSSRERTAARYSIVDGTLRLRIDEDTPEWSPDFDPGSRVSNLQTGVGSGPVGSTAGQHHFRERTRSFAGLRIGTGIHLEPKTAALLDLGFTLQARW